MIMIVVMMVIVIMGDSRDVDNGENCDGGGDNGDDSCDDNSVT